MNDTFERILLVKISSMGDVLHALPAACALRDRFPDAELTWLVDERFADLLRGHRAISDVIVARAPRWVNRVRFRQDVARGAAHFRAIAELRRRPFDLAIDLQGLFRSAVLARSSGAKDIVGFASAREGAPLLYTKRVRHSSHPHVVRHYLDLVEPYTGRVRDVRFDLPVDVAAEDAVSTWLSRAGITTREEYVVIAPKSSRSEKDWPAVKMAEVARHLRARGVPIVLIGGGAERERCDEIAALLGAPIPMMIGEPLARVMALLRRSRLLVGPDSGPVHLAAALGTSVIALFGPTPPARLAPWGFEHLVATARESCPLCQHQGLLKPMRLRHRCLDELSPAMVIRRVEEVLSRRQVA